MPEVDYSHRNQRFGLFRHLYETYDRSVLAVVCFNYFNQGAFSMILMVIVNMFQDEFNISATQA